MKSLIQSTVLQFWRVCTNTQRELDATLGCTVFVLQFSQLLRNINFIYTTAVELTIPSLAPGPILAPSWHLLAPLGPHLGARHASRKAYVAAADIAWRVSTACAFWRARPEHVPSVVGGAMHMLCPDEIGRDVWDRVGRASVGWQAVSSPHGMGEETLADVCSRAGGKGPAPPRT